MKTTRECIEWIKLLYDAYPTYSEDFEDYLRCAQMYLGSFEQIKWERDVAIEQLNEYGKQLGEI
jgi:hypothetical protein